MANPVIILLQRSYPSAVPTATDDIDVGKLPIFPDVHYSEGEKAEIHQWLITAAHIASPSEDEAKTAERLSSLNTHLSTRTTLLGSKPSVADIAVYSQLAPVVSKWSPEQRTGERGYHHIVRHLDFVQNAPLFGLKLEDSGKVTIDPDEVVFKIKPIDPRAEKERKKKEKEALAAAGAAAAAAAGGTKTSLASKTESAVPSDAKRQGKPDKGNDLLAAAGDAAASTAGASQPSSEKKAKKEKAPKQPKQPPAPKEIPLSPALIDLRVGHILKAEAHPNADSLYVSTIAVGDIAGADNTSDFEGKVVRTVCSGLNGLVPLSEMQGRKVICVCNLKPVTMRGIKSAAMVLAASPREDESDGGHKGPVELVNPPENAEAGDRVYFEGWEGEPEGQLNPKKKVWEMCQVGFTTTEDRVVGFEADKVPQLVSQVQGESGASGDNKRDLTAVATLRTKDGVCTVKSLKGATVRLSGKYGDFGKTQSFGMVRLL